MNDCLDVEESLREAAATGNIEKLENLVQQGVNVNSQNAVNGWTPLHWACRRNQRRIVEFLLKHGANSSIVTLKGETCLQLTADPQIRQLLGGDRSSTAIDYLPPTLPITPNYIANPVFPYASNSIIASSQMPSVKDWNARQLSTVHQPQIPLHDDLVLKVRLADSDETDFIEIDIARGNTTYKQLIELIRCELCIDASAAVYKLRKLPDTIIRNDRDVGRLRDYNELELVIRHDKTRTETTPSATMYKATVSPKVINVVY